METDMTPVCGFLGVHDYGGTSRTKVIIVGSTPKRFRIRAITRTKLAGRNRYLEPGEETLVPKYAIMHEQNNESNKEAP